MNAADVAGFDECIASGGVALFPADTVYGLAADAGSEAAVTRLYEIKRRAARIPAAVMFFELERALTALPALGPRTAEALGRLLPGPVTVLVEEPGGRYPLARPGGGPLGLRVPLLSGALSPLAASRSVVLQSSANLHGEPEARTLGGVSPEIAASAAFALDGGELPGVASTVIDLSRIDRTGEHSIVREGAVPAAAVAAALGA